MPSINLISDQRKWKRDRQKKSRTWFIAFLVLSTVGLTSVGVLTLQLEMLRAELRALQTQALVLRPLKDEIGATKEALNEFVPRVDTLVTARVDSERWGRIFDHVGRVMPDDTWLTRVESHQPSDPRKPVEVTWTGMSAEQSLVGELMLLLQRSGDLSGIELKYTDLRRTSRGVGLEFQILCQVPGTGADDRAEKKESSKS
ncbi:MAG: PilN domain-containing protein [Armatimonadetes bacterium]|nr:PilN domain-containing protein [Armatimonadota bacterium]